MKAQGFPTNSPSFESTTYLPGAMNNFAPANSASLFPGASNFCIYRGQFTALLSLHESSSTSALVDAKAPRQCHPGTREEILKSIEEWAYNGNSRGSYWISGMAGTGKFTIARSVSNTFAKDGLLAGSFFFSRFDPSRNNPKRLFTTIASQWPMRNRNCAQSSIL
ncbi:hypothetical protein GYMLUDRAFT_982785 [Collybiopsis luxurians FD-317 M1]|uniref:Nephrocystin 3-like N-terminal domain-containing protein n=1 Tax=Collybiopsis luxurians FD-317 M1 TaxID=944289 RepID=A0A0D0B9Y3_9AGAR|nr:hypothetical protein GYMLUDRAFT_982785 [Collybiopsis luxurians FD-317 M1]